jgi:UDP-N-acetylmuramoyl-L-alanyl-D-glutamate--2,6-diaminopimelate ligase
MSVPQGITTIAVTGTNGKTSTTSMLAEIARAAGQVPVRVTTLGMWVGDEQVADDSSMQSFERTLRRAHEVGAKTLALEVTSLALENGFARRFPPDIAVFTNITRDHLDRHGTPERYLAAKAQLFLNLRKGGVAVLNAGDPVSALLGEVIPPGVRKRGYSPLGDAEPGPTALPIALAARNAHSDEHGTRIDLAPSPLAQRLRGQIAFAVLGAFQVDNALAAAVAADAAGFSAEAIATGLARFAGVPGRFEICSRSPLTVVDYAHTPDALRRVLESARALAAQRGGRLGCVFGCGGERDRDKRPLMGELASRLADAIWLTTDNPRSESPAEIAAMVRSGAHGNSHWHEVLDRRLAIRLAVDWAEARDVVVVAGRGHESHQVFADGARPLRDNDAIFEAMRHGKHG